MANAIEKNTEKKTAKSGKQLRLAPLADNTLMKIYKIVDAVKNGANVAGIIDSAKADKAMQLKIGAACILGVIVDYNGKSRSFTVKALIGGEIVQYTVSTTGNKLVKYLVDAGEEGESATGYDTTYIKRLKVLTETGALIPCLSYIGQIRKQSFDVLGAFFKKEFGTFRKLFGKDKLPELEKLTDAEPQFEFSYQDCEDAIKYRDYLQEIITNAEGTYPPEYVKKAQDRLTEINGVEVKNTANGVN